MGRGFRACPGRAGPAAQLLRRWDVPAHNIVGAACARMHACCPCTPSTPPASTHPPTHPRPSTLRRMRPIRPILPRVVPLGQHQWAAAAMPPPPPPRTIHCMAAAIIAGTADADGACTRLLITAGALYRPLAGPHHSASSCGTACLEGCESYIHTCMRLRARLQPAAQIHSPPPSPHACQNHRACPFTPHCIASFPPLDLSYR